MSENADELPFPNDAMNGSDAAHLRLPLHWAAAKRKGEFGKWLLKKGAKPDLPDARGWTPLFLADANGAHDLIPVLLAAGARTEGTIDGRTIKVKRP